EDKHHLLLLDGRALVAYVTRGSVAVACGDPLAADDDFPAAVHAYADHCVEHGWTALVYLARAERVPVYQAAGFVAVETAVEAVLPLQDWVPVAPPIPSGTAITVRRYDRDLEPDPHWDAELETVSEEWLRA